MIESYVKKYASVVEWSITTDCKSVGFGLRRFKSYPTHKNIPTREFFDASGVTVWETVTLGFENL